MSALRLAFSALLRDWRSGELMTLLAALIIGVTALSAVSMFTSRITVAVQRQAGEVLAADLVWRSGRPASAELRASAADFNLKTANVSSFPSMAWAGDEGGLAEVRAVDDAYPLRGTILVADKLFGESSATNAVPRSGEAWAEARLLARHGFDPDFGARPLLDDGTPVFERLDFALRLQREDLRALPYLRVISGARDSVVGFRQLWSSMKTFGSVLSRERVKMAV